MSRPAGIVTVSILFSIIVLFLGCGRKEVKKEIPPRPVQTALAVQRDAPYYVESFGYITSLYSVNIVSQVTGKIVDCLFIEGQDVKKGDKLFTIDKAPFQADLDKALAMLDQDSAQLKYSIDTVERNKPLVKETIIPEQTFEQYQTQVLLYKAKVDLDKAQIESYRISLGYCDISSPVDGVTSKRYVDPGNIVPANSGPTLVSVRTIDTLYVDFPVPERDLDAIRSAMDKGKITIEVQNETGSYSREGELKLVENEINVKTGTISLRATIDNKDKKFWSGQFVRIRLHLGTVKDAVAVPPNAVQLGLDGYYIFRVKDGKVEFINVKVGVRSKDYVVIEGSLIKPGDKVVTVGQMSLNDGVAVHELENAESSGDGKEAGKK